MSWRDNLRSASFRGVGFKVMSTTTEVGRRVLIYNFPFQDQPFTEDFGKEAGIYQVVGYVIQNAGNAFDYFAERDALKQALEQAGPGILVHPFYGEVEVVLQGRASIDEAFAEGGIARFKMTFVEVGKVQLPLDTVDAVGSVTAFVDELIIAVGNVFEDLYDIAGPSYLLDSAAADLISGLQEAQKALYTVQTTAADAVTSVLLPLSVAVTTVDSIVAAPANIVTAMGNIFAAFKSVIPFSVGTSLVDSALAVQVYAGANDPIPTTTETRLQQLQNRNAMVAYLRVGTVAEACRAAASVQYKSYQQAYATLAGLIAAVDDLLEYVGVTLGNDELYSQVQDLKPVVVKSLLTLGASLPSVSSFTPASGSYPSLVIAHRLYNDLGREQEIIDRNQPQMVNPGFPTGGAALEVLSK